MPGEMIHIVGGGLAGLTLGTLLSRQRVPATVYESGTYPRQKVCGEFISGRGKAVIKRLGLLDTLPRESLSWARTAAFYTERSRTGILPLPEPALCVPRTVLDAKLAEEFQRAGGALHTNHRWKSECAKPGIVRANGRRIRNIVEGWRWFGLKAHATNVKTDADLELHLMANGYVGICRLPGEGVNVCGLFRSREKEENLHLQWRQWLQGPVGSHLHRSMEEVEWKEDSFCAVSALDFRPGRARNSREVSIGDALTMIPPLTGNGMSIAFETAELAGPALMAYSRREMCWEEMRFRLGRELDRSLKRRLGWAGFLQRCFFQPALRGFWIEAVHRSSAVWGYLFRNTR